jgi:type IV fimbrial biogenesis protein FimT
MTTMARDGTGTASPAQAGVTALETMLVLAILAMLLVLAVPGLRALMLDTRRSTRVLDMVATLNLARSEALKRGTRVTACPSADGLDCNDDTRWETGWIVFSDANSNGTVDAGEERLLVQPALAGEGTLRGTRKRLTYQAYGFSTGFNDTLRVCDTRGPDWARSVIVSNQGRVRVKASASTCP